MAWVTFTNITCFTFAVYIFITAKSFYDLFNPATCSLSKRSDCLYPLKNWQNEYTLAVCVPKKVANSQIQCSQLIDLRDLYLKESFSKDVEIDVPEKTQKNGTLTVYILITPRSGVDNLTSISKHGNTIYKELRLSRYKQNRTSKYVNLLETRYSNKEASGDNVIEINNETNNNLPLITHLLTVVNIHTLDSMLNLDRMQVPSELYNDLKFTNENEYMPIMHIDKLSIKDELFKPLNESQRKHSIRIEHFPISIGKFRLLKQLEGSIDTMKELGFNEKQLEELISLFTEANIYLVLVTFVVSILHLFFEFLAFRNDINFWRKRKTTVGLSVKTVAWRAISQVIIIVYLFEQETSLVILVPSCISIFIELWKLFKAFKVTIEFNSSFIPTIKFGEYSKKEIESNSYDSIAMKKLSYLLYPLCILGAIYSLVYNEHKSWLSWVVNSMANGVYAFGFLFMTPQLFLNYKLKSVAHLPWKAFMYKAFNTFIDDLFAFIIKMPTTHRIACLRDDVVFVVYLYQRWLYPIDKTRTNEFGEAFEDTAEKTSSEEKPKKE